jgi:hypothetical protein
MAKQTFTTGQVLTAAQMTSLQQTAMGGGAATAKTASYVLTAADAGTVVQMNAAGATTITINTALFSAGDSVQIQNIGAGVCTITAGTATVTTAGSLALSQWEGGNLYFTSTSASIFFDIVQGAGMTNPMTTTGDTIYSSSGSTPARLGIGTTGQVLTVASGVPSWATPAAGGGGKVLQVVYGSTSTNTANSTTTYADTTLTATITPTLNTSKVLVIVNQNGCGHGAVNAIEWLRIMRDSTQILEISDLIGYTASATTQFGLSVGATKLDSPATTSATIYKTQFRSEDTNTVRVQGNNSSTCNSTITLLEIGA